MMVAKYLEEEKIPFECPKQFPDLQSSRGYPLRYDFYLPDRNMLIEINGGQHYQKSSCYGDAYFERLVQHDRMKKEYAQRIGAHYHVIDTFHVTDDRRVGKTESDMRDHLTAILA